MLKNTYDLSNKTVLIIGGLGWLGTEYTIESVKAGANVIVFDYFDINDWKSRLQESVYSKINVVPFNGYEHDDYKEKLASTIQSYQKIDILINNAFDFSSNTGFVKERNKFENSIIQDWKNALESGVTWSLISSQAILSQKDISDIKIINIASMYGIVAPNPDNYINTNSYMLPQYGIAKAGIINLTKYIASYYGHRGVCCNAIAPGAFPKENVITDDFKKQLINNIPLNRLGKPKDLSGIMMFLMSEDSNYITGQVITVDGGWTIR